MKTIKKALKTMGLIEKDLLKSIDILFQDLMNHAECLWDYRSIRYSTVMTTNEWSDFYTHPERKPYTSQVLSKLSERDQLDLIFKILKETYAFYVKLPESKAKKTLRSSISSLIDYSLNAYYDTELMRLEDALIGRTAEDRDAGNVNPTPYSITLLDYAIKEYAYLFKKDEQVLHKKIYDLCNGRIGILNEYYSTCDLDDEIRTDIYEITQIFSRDKTLAFFDIKVGWEIWKILRDMGIDTEEYLKLNDFPSYNVIKNKLLAFQNNKGFIEETLKHLQDDLPLSYKKYKKQGYVYRKDLMIEEAKRKKYPKELRSDKEIKQMVKECTDEIYSYFPLAKELSPRNVLLNPIHPAATRRAFQSSVRNAHGKRVNTIVMTPRADHKDDYLPTFAHEVTHAVHRMILELGEEHGVLEKGSSERIPSSVMEDFSQLVEEQFHVDRDLPYTKKFKGKEFPNFMSAFTIRFQVPFALSQLSIRKEFDALWNSGYRDVLTEEQLWNLKTKMDAQVKNWHELGLKIISPNLTAFALFESFNPDDGLVYMKRYFVENKSSAAKDEKAAHLKMPDALKKRFGKEWVKNKDARALLLWLLLETGRNHATETFGKMLLTKSIEECYEELAKISITKSNI